MPQNACTSFSWKSYLVIRMSSRTILRSLPVARRFARMATPESGRASAAQTASVTEKKCSSQYGKLLAGIVKQSNAASITAGQMHMKKVPIIIVGGGPVGAVMALALHRREIPFVLLDAEADVVEDQRAATLHPPTLEMMNELGLLNTIREEGLFAPVFRHWDRLSGRLVAEFNMTRLKDETKFPYAIQFEQYKLVRLILSHLSGAHG